MTNEQREQILHALRHGREDDMELEVLIREDLADIEPLIDLWIAQARITALESDLAVRITRIENHLHEKFGELP